MANAAMWYRNRVSFSEGQSSVLDSEKELVDHIEES